MVNVHLDCFVDEEEIIRDGFIQFSLVLIHGEEMDGMVDGQIHQGLFLSEALSGQVVQNGVVWNGGSYSWTCLVLGVH